MGTVMTHNAVSADGFTADEKDQADPLSGHYGNGDIELSSGSGTSGRSRLSIRSKTCTQ